MISEKSVEHDNSAFERGSEHSVLALMMKPGTVNIFCTFNLIN